MQTNEMIQHLESERAELERDLNTYHLHGSDALKRVGVEWRAETERQLEVIARTLDVVRAME